MNSRHSRWQRDALPLSYARNNLQLIYSKTQPLQRLFWRNRGFLHPLFHFLAGNFVPNARLLPCPNLLSNFLRRVFFEYAAYAGQPESYCSTSRIDRQADNAVIGKKNRKKLGEIEKGKLPEQFFCFSIIRLRGRDFRFEPPEVVVFSIAVDTRDKNLSSFVP